MPLEVFTAPWAEAWAEALRASASYRRAAARWEGNLLLVLAADPARGVPAERGVLLDLWHGECRAARLVDGAGEPPEPLDHPEAKYVVRAGPEVWRDVLSRRIEPLFAIVAGRLRLQRGSLAALTPFAAAARELVLAAATLEARFPGDPA